MHTLCALIVDDDRDTARFFRVILEMAGFNCTLAHSAKEALNHLASHQPDMILLDMRLGLELGGEDILYQIRTNPRIDQSRVIVITAYPDMAAHIGDLADLVMVKPVDIEHLQTLSARLTHKDYRPRYFHDPVTGLYNRGFLLNRLEYAFERWKRRPELLFSILLLEITPLPAGAETGPPGEPDKLLKELAATLKPTFRPTDTLARYDTFCLSILNEDLKQPQDLQVILGRLRGVLDGLPLAQFPGGAFTYRLAGVLNERAYASPEEILECAQAELQHELS